MGASPLWHLPGLPTAMKRPLSTADVILADDHRLVRSGIRSLLEAIEGVRVVAEVSDGGELLGAMESVHSDIVITDLSMPGIDGVTAISRISELYPSIRTMVLSMHDSAEIVKRAWAAGACAYLRKSASASEFASVVGSVMNTGSYVSASVAKLLAEPPGPMLDDVLTPRQIEILRLLAEGRSSKDIGFNLGLSSKTVDVHRTRIMDRLHIRDLPTLTIYAVRNGLVKL